MGVWQFGWLVGLAGVRGGRFYVWGGLLEYESQANE